MDDNLRLAASGFARYDLSKRLPAVSMPSRHSWTTAMTARTAVTLRLLGPLIEVACLIVLLKVRDQDRQVLGIPVEYPLYAGLAVGFALVVIGLTFSFSRPSKKSPRDLDL